MEMSGDKNQHLYRQKDFRKWMALKEKINNGAKEENIIRYHEGEIYWVCLGENIGQEQDGKSALYSRPVVIVKGFSAHLVLAAPLTTTYKVNPYYFSFKHKGRISVAILSQMRSLDLARVCKGGYYGKITRRTLRRLQEACAKIICPDNGIN